MRVLIDTSIWSLSFRKKEKSKNEEKIIKELEELIRELRVVLIGPIRQEILSGISDNEKFENLKEKLTSFEDLPLKQIDYEKAAEISNICRRNGIQGSHINYLICAVSINNDLSIFTLDKDFNNYKKYSKINIYTLREEINK